MKFITDNVHQHMMGAAAATYTFVIDLPQSVSGLLLHLVLAAMTGGMTTLAGIVVKWAWDRATKKKS